MQFGMCRARQLVLDMLTGPALQATAPATLAVARRRHASGISWKPNLCS